MLPYAISMRRFDGYYDMLFICIADYAVSCHYAGWYIAFSCAALFLSTPYAAPMLLLAWYDIQADSYFRQRRLR